MAQISIIINVEPSVEPRNPVKPNAIESGNPGNMEFRSSNLIVITKPINIPIIVKNDINQKIQRP
jgi:hypothetical protein